MYSLSKLPLKERNIKQKKNKVLSDSFLYLINFLISFQ